MEAALHSIDLHTIVLSYLAYPTLKAVGIYLLGDAAWSVVQPKLMVSTIWDDFKEQVEPKLTLVSVIADSSGLFIKWNPRLTKLPHHLIIALKMSCWHWGCTAMHVCKPIVLSSSAMLILLNKLKHCAT